MGLKWDCLRMICRRENAWERAGTGTPDGEKKAEGREELNWHHIFSVSRKKFMRAQAEAPKRRDGSETFRGVFGSLEE